MRIETSISHDSGSKHLSSIHITTHSLSCDDIADNGRSLKEGQPKSEDWKKQGVSHQIDLYLDSKRILGRNFEQSSKHQAVKTNGVLYAG